MDLFKRLKRMTTLLVDPDAWIRESMQVLFQQEGCKLTAVETAEEGIKVLQCDSYDVIIADYGLPDMNGLEFFKQIYRSHPKAAKLLTTTTRLGAVSKSDAEINQLEVIEKPFSKNTIAAGLSRVFPEQEVLDAALQDHSEGGDRTLNEE